VPGARSIDSLGYGVASVIEAPDASSWAILHDPRTTASVRGLVGHFDGDGLAGVIRVVDGCTLGALAAGPGGVWAATCDPNAVPDAQTGAELVRVDVTGDAPARRVGLPGGCVTKLIVNDGYAWATNQALADTPPHLWRIDLASGHVDEPAAAAGSAVNGLVSAGDGVWASRRSGALSSLVLLDDATGAARATVDIGNASLLGSGGSTLWTYDFASSALSARDLASGAVTTTVPVPNLRKAAPAPDGLWYEQAAPGGLTITIGRIAPSGSALGAPVAFAGAGPDRTGLPFLADLSATTRGLWLALQDRLFVLPA
jgi:hypothetical protein